MKGTHVKMTMSVTAWNGKLLFKHRKNHIVSQGMKALLYFAAGSGIPTAGWSYQFPTPGAGSSQMKMGTDTTTVTVESMVALVAAIATIANSASVVLSKVATGHYRVAWTSTWNAATISGTIGEMGLYMYAGAPLDATLPLANPTGQGAGALYFVSRLSAADTDFTAFAVNIAKPLVIEWDFDLTFS